jgi:hypothetical protein
MYIAKIGFFVGGHSHGNRRAGGVSPPWGAFDANAKRGNSSHCSCRRGLTNTTAGSRPPLLWACVCTSQMSYSAPNGRGAIKSGWRKPAVVWGTHLQVICEKSRTSFDRPNTRRAHARRSCSSVASSSNGGRFSPHRVRFTDHGGLTPAALVDMRMYIAKIGFSSADIRTATEERGGRKPPVGCIRCERETRKFVSLQLQTRAYKHHGGLTPAALVRPSHRRRMVGDFRRTAFGLPTTAG